MKYLALWQEYDRGPAPLVRITFSAEDDNAALRKVFDKKIIDEDWDGDLAEFLEDAEMTEEELTPEFLGEYFDNIDTSGWPFLANLSNLDTKETVYDCGFDYDESEDWDDDDESEDDDEDLEEFEDDEE